MAEQPPRQAPDHGAGTAPGPALTIAQFRAVDLRVAVVLTAERVPSTDRLLRLEIDLGEERRTIVSGIAHVYEPESLVGLRIVVVANLMPARIRGIESRGMLLAAGGRDPDEDLGLVILDKPIPAGTRVSWERDLSVPGLVGLDLGENAVRVVAGDRIDAHRE